MRLCRLFGVAVTTLCMCVNFSACRNGDDAGSGDFTGERKLVKMIFNYADVGEIYLFNYDNQGRAIEAKWAYVDDDNNAWNQLFIWKDNTLQVMDDGSHRCTYTIKNGLVRSEYVPPYDNYSGALNVYYTYNTSNRLIREISERNGQSYSYYTTWNADKLISQEGAGDYDVTYTYEDLTCIKGYCPLYLLDQIYMAHPEIFGMKSTQLPVSCAKKHRGGQSECDYTETYQYEFDAEGYISKIIVKDDKGYTYPIILTWK